MIQVVDINIGNVVRYEDKLCIIRDKNGPSSDSVTVYFRLQDIATGESIDLIKFVDEELEVIDIITKGMQYSYVDGKNYFFMDIESYEQFALQEDKVKDIMPYIAEDSIVTMSFVEGKLLDIIIPEVVELKVVEVDKDAQIITLETGLKLNRLCDLEVGDKVKINTENGTYIDKIEV